MPALPPKQSLSGSRALSEELPGWRTKLLDGVSRVLRHKTAHKHRVPDSMGKGNCALRGSIPKQFGQLTAGGGDQTACHRHTKASSNLGPT